MQGVESRVSVVVQGAGCTGQRKRLRWVMLGVEKRETSEVSTIFGLTSATSLSHFFLRLDLGFMVKVSGEGFQS